MGKNIISETYVFNNNKLVHKIYYYLTGTDPSRLHSSLCPYVRSYFWALITSPMLLIFKLIKFLGKSINEYLDENDKYYSVESSTINDLIEEKNYLKSDKSKYKWYLDFMDILGRVRFQSDSSNDLIKLESLDVTEERLASFRYSEKIELIKYERLEKFNRFKINILNSKYFNYIIKIFISVIIILLSIYLSYNRDIFINYLDHSLLMTILIKAIISFILCLLLFGVLVTLYLLIESYSFIYKLSKFISKVKSFYFYLITYVRDYYEGKCPMIYWKGDIDE